MAISGIGRYNKGKTARQVISMLRTPITLDLSRFPEEFHPLLEGSPVFDSSCSPEAGVLFLDREGGLFLKSAPAHTLKQEALMTAWFHSRDLGPEVLSYLSLDRDWLLTRRIPGEDCTHANYLEDPLRLCDTLARLLRQLHDQSTDGCPVADRTRDWILAARNGRQAGLWDPGLFPEVWQFSSSDAAWQAAQEVFPHLRADVPLHGDYCLPNVLLDDWRFSGFIDVGRGGIGDRHIDLFWGCWTLNFNLHTNRYFDRFLDAYGRDRVQPELLRGIAAAETFG